LRAFENCATVGENSHFIRRNAEAEKEFIVTDGFGGSSKARAEGGEIQRAETLMDLHGVAAAHSDVRLSVALEVGKIAAGAGTAVCVAGDFHGLETPRPDIAGK